MPCGSRAPAGVAGAQVITTNRGLLPPETPVGLLDLREFGTVDIRADDPRYRAPVDRDLARLAMEPGLEVVLLGSVATGKYVDVLLEALGDRLVFPIQFLGRGDMILRCCSAGGHEPRVCSGGRYRCRTTVTRSS